MKLETILFALRMRRDGCARAEELAQMAYIQWLGTLVGADSYVDQARYALQRAQNLTPTDPAVTAFCTLLERSMDRLGFPLPIIVARPKRRGGAKARRATL